MSIYLGSSKPSKIYVGSNEVSAVYVGTTKVRPYRFEYSYDFSNGSTSKMQTDGWTGYSGASFNADGIYCTTRHEYRVQPSGLSSIISSANEITIDIYYYKNGTANADYGNTLVTGLSGYTNETGIYGNYKVVCIYSGGTDLNNGGTATIANGWHKITEVINIKNKTLNYDFPGVKTQTYSITDAQIANIKLCNTIMVPQHKNSYIKTISVKIK